MKTTSLLALALVMLLGTSGVGQYISATVSPSPTVPGAYVQGSVEATAATYLGTGCGLDSVHQGSPTGPIVFQPMICPMMLIIVGPGAPWSIASMGNVIGNGFNDPSSPAAAGTYYIRYSGSDPSTGASVAPQFIPIRIDDPTAPLEPTLSPVGVGVAARGASVPLQITADISEGGSYYHVMASLTSNTGLDVIPGFVRLDLDQDILFDLSFPVHHPALFTNALGTLDATGTTTAPVMHIPNVPALQAYPLKIQAVLLGGPCGVCFTNTLSFSIY